ncbi:hypothetical protein [Leadbettera azotonutricia]|uniref:Uncharacterized protein n=1 Tax=Leadbettera azotonutricia (strain ATCC BAA-888 / DSM 13862 / ZAS-9) TaxID=545695 RepID=F5Y9L9_LEAAZ|nr:hypothetical protein [Leadbettera azotonutricia]AEF83200.1 conserved hypothetical protein [Leadbettera azotonutricia ZAS-9]
MKRIIAAAYFLTALLFALTLSAQDFGFGGADDTDDSGFGSFDSASSGGFSSPGVKISGDIQAEFKAFFEDMDNKEELKEIQLGNIFSGSLNFSVSGSAAEAIINLKLKPVFESIASPVSIDEAYGRFYFGPVNLEAGIRKLTWGKADSFGPLDVVNPLDYSDLSSMSDPQSIKIGRPLLHASWNIGTFSKLEAVFVPWFKGHTFALEGRWAPAELTSLVPILVMGVKGGLAQHPVLGTDPVNFLPPFYIALDSWQTDLNFEKYYSDYNYTLRSAQAGLRFTTTLGSSDFGFQYYYGRLPRPAFSVNLDKYIAGIAILPPTLPATEPEYISNPNDIEILMAYNFYHQIGVDFARVVAGFNLRAETAINLTSDTDGTDGGVYNPFFAWSLGFDRDLVWGINLNLQGTGSMRLFQSKLGDNLLEDMEAGKDISSTRITAIVSKKFFREELEVKATGLWGIEDKDFLIIPAIVWSRNDITAELAAGFFGGDRAGELGQYKDNSYIKVALGYSF